MGWTSTADTLENVGRAALNFYTKVPRCLLALTEHASIRARSQPGTINCVQEEAVRFCVKHGWEYTVDEPNLRRTTRQKRYAQYGDNYT